MTVAIIAGTLGITSTVSAHNEVENYLDVLVKTQVANTKAELQNQAQQQVLTANYRFELNEQPEQALIAKVTVTYLTEADIVKKDAE